MWCKDVVSNLFNQYLALTTVGHYLVLPAAPLVPSPRHQREGNVNYFNVMTLQMYIFKALNQREMKPGRSFHLMYLQKGISLVYLYVLLMILCIYGVFIMQIVAQEGRVQAWRAANRTAVACLEARGTRMQKTTAVSVTSPAKVCLTTRYVCPQKLQFASKI